MKKDKELFDMIEECLRHKLTCENCPYVKGNINECWFFEKYQFAPEEFTEKVPNVKAMKRYLIEQKLENL